MSKYGVISDPYFPVFGLNAEIYGVNLRIQFEYRKIRTRNNSVLGHFSNHMYNSRLARLTGVFKSHVDLVLRIIGSN